MSEDKPESLLEQLTRLGGQVAGVLVDEGLTAFTVIPDPSRSRDSALVRPKTPPLPTPYASVFGMPMIPARDTRFTMRPQPCSRIEPSACREQKNEP